MVGLGDVRVVIIGLKVYLVKLNLSTGTELGNNIANGYSLSKFKSSNVSDRSSLFPLSNS